MISAIFIDVMFTVLIPRDGKSRFHIRQELIKNILGEDVDLDVLKKTYEEARSAWEEKLPPNHGVKWAIIDREILLKLFPNLTVPEATRAGKSISEEILSNPLPYHILF